MSWHTYCALCAASFTPGGTDDYGEFRNVTELFYWAFDLQVVDRNPSAVGLSCCYISGEGDCDYRGTATCRPSNDPNCPAPNNGSNTFAVSTYYDFVTMQEGAIPMHSKCLEIFSKVLAREKGASFSQLNSVDLDPDILFSAMHQKRQSKGLRCLDIEYFELDSYKGERYFIAKTFNRKLLPFLMDPINITTMNDYVNNMPIATPNTGTIAMISHSLLSNDTFSALPPEILMEILMILPAMSFTRLLIASPATRQTQLTSSFWRKRVEIHMPWSWEVISHAARNDNSYDWEKIYHDLDRFSGAPGDSIQAFDSLGFPNRRRIYNVCQQLVSIYMQLENEAEATLSTGFSEEILQNAKCEHFVGVSMPLVSAFSAMNRFMLPRWSDIAHERKTLGISWNGSGVLARISLTIRGICSAVEASEIGAIAGLTTDTLVIKEGDWIEGFIFSMSAPEPKIIGVTIKMLRSPHVTFGSMEGIGLRLMSVYGENVFVGLKASVMTDHISRLGILQCPLPATVDLPLSPPEVTAPMRTLIWKNQLLPPSIRASPYISGFQNLGEEATESGQIMESLVFGLSETQLSTLTGIAVSADTLGFFVYHKDMEPSFIGLSKKRLKYFPIDGPGGERVIKFSVGFKSTPTGFTIMTNQGRQGIFGWSYSSDRIHQFTETTSDGAIIGLYASFGNLKGFPQITAIGALHSPSISSQPPATADTLRNWDPTPPPVNWQPEGPVYGSPVGFSRTYLDLTKPIAKITGLLAAPDWYHIFDLGGFVITYMDGSTCYIGIPTDEWAEVHDAASASTLQKHHHDKDLLHVKSLMSWQKDEYEKVDEGAVAHATTVEAVEQNHGGACWDLGLNGAQINMITVWAERYLNGIQFHTADGRASPRWGKCGQATVAVITTDLTMPLRETNLNVTVHTGAVGVAFNLQWYRNHHEASDARPAGLQVLVSI